MESEGKKKLNGVEDAKRMIEQLIKFSKDDCLEPMRGEVADWKAKVEEAMSEVAARKVIIKVRPDLSLFPSSSKSKRIHCTALDLEV